MQLTPYLNFAGTTEEAFGFYREVLGGEVLGPARFRDFGDSMGPLSEEDKDKVANMALRLPNGTMIMGTDALASLGQNLQEGNNFSLHLECEDEAEAERVFAGLSQGGEVQMPPGKTEWAAWFGGCKDRYGISWMISHTGDVTFTPAPA